MSTMCMPGPAACGQEPCEVLVIAHCLRRIRCWRVPPRWSQRDWSEEMGAEAATAALQAARDFDPAGDVPWELFLRRRVMRAAMGRYRREWTYALRRASVAAWEEYGTVADAELPPHEATFRVLREALGRLPEADAWLIEGLFWEGETEAGLGQVLGISQQAVSKRKRKILKSLKVIVNEISSYEILY